jgi:SAM-dependent methyltransferase
VAFCNRHYKLPGLTFLCGDAEALPFNACRFDAVVNIEAAMNYGSMERFVAEVHRVLRPGGSFLFADQCAAGDAAELRAALLRPGFEIVRERDITANIVAALDESSAPTTTLIDRLIARPLRPLVQQFAGVRGTLVYQRFASGSLRYKLFTLRKPESLGSV